MICPICKSEYRRGVTQCSDCGVSLVDTLEPSAMESQQQEQEEDEGALVQVWSGDDPRESAAVKAALEKAEISYTDKSAAAYFIFRSMRPKMEIRVLATDAERAQELIRNLLGEPPVAESEEDTSGELPADSDAADEIPDDAVPEYPTGDWDEEEAVSEVWSGEEVDVATMLVACFRENGIASRSLIENAWTRLLVRPEDEPHAKEIVREVVEAKPPQ
jgi:hypothetical protein